MGSGHFLVAAVDRIEARLSALIALRPIAHVTVELQRLRNAALDALGDLGDGVEIEHSSLLRRQVARRCIYGVDRNPVAVELARLSLWIHTFVPGLPLSFLDHSLVCGNSLTGVGTIDEAIDALDPGATASLFREPILAVLDRARSALSKLSRLSDASNLDIAQARSAQAEMQRAIQPARDLFDLIVAARLGRTAFPTDDGEPIAIPLPTAFDDEAVATNPSLGRARLLAEALESLHFPIAFPEAFIRERPGFDCILGNPPWDKVRFEPQQFWVGRAPGLNALPAHKRDEEIAKLRLQRPDDAAAEAGERVERERLQEIARSAYRLQGRGQHGHHDFAKLFCERAIELSGDGTIGYVLPRQALVLGGWKDLRSHLLRGHVVDAVQARNRGGWLFEGVHESYMVILMTRRRAPPGADEVRVLGGVEDEATLARYSPSTALILTVTEIETFTETLVVPLLNGQADMPAFSAMKAYPRLGGEMGWISVDVVSSLWDFSGSGPHGRFATNTGDDGSWSVLMARHVDQYEIMDDPFNRFIAEPLDLVALAKGVSVIDGRPVLAEAHPWIIFRYPSRADDTRTLYATCLPESGFLFSKGYVHGLRHASGTPSECVLALVGYLNSFTADWWARRFVDRHVTKPVLANLPLPKWSNQDIRGVASTVGELLVRGGLRNLPGGQVLRSNPALAPQSDEDLRISIEIAVARGFGLDGRALAEFFKDFSNDACPERLRDALLGAI